MRAPQQTGFAPSNENLAVCWSRKDTPGDSPPFDFHWLIEATGGKLSGFSVATEPSEAVMEFWGDSFGDVSYEDVERRESVWKESCQVSTSSLYVIRTQDGNYGLVRFTSIDVKLPGPQDQAWSLVYEWLYRSDGVFPSPAEQLAHRVQMPTIQPTSTLQPTDTPVPTPTPTSVPALASSVRRISSPDVTRSDLRELAAGNSAFAFDLYQAIRTGEDNLLYSPFSISQALAMTYAGARGETELQMADTLHFTLPQERLHPAFNALDLSLVGRSQTFQLNIASALWGQIGYPFRDEYVNLLAQNYGASIQLVDFKRDAHEADNIINRWVSNKTAGRIQELVSPDSIPPDTRLWLVNAIYFNAKWSSPFDEKHTYDEPFYMLDGRQERVHMMHQEASFQYTEGDSYQVIELPYESHKVAMVVLLPEEDQFREIEKGLTSQWAGSVLTSLGEHKVILTMPRFCFETPKINLGEILSTMGMPNAFAEGADFSGMDSTGDLTISGVLHKAFIDVNEQRTEAAAVTGIEMLEVEKVIEEEPPIVMKIDRPFIFLIRDIQTDAILFVGRVMNPALE